MSKPYDASTKYLIDRHLHDWLPLSNRQTSSSVEIMETDVSTVSAVTDKVLYVHDLMPWILHAELQSSWEGFPARRLHYYNALLEYRYDVLVHTMVILLRRQADSPHLTGNYECGFSGENPYRTFRYQVVRVWQCPLDDILKGGLGLLPLAPLTDEAANHLPDVIHAMEERIQQEAAPEEAANLWTATDVLMGLRYSRELVDQLTQGVGKMEESVTYQAIIEKGMQKGEILAIRRMLIVLGTDRFGPPDAQTIAALEGITNVDHLQDLGKRLLHVSSWKELLHNGN